MAIFRKKLIVSVTLAALIANLSSVALADTATSATAAGGNAGASSDGSIPAFESGNSVQGWKPDQFRGDAWKHKGEKPLFVIDASNVDKYAAHLTEGQIALVKQTKGYTMPVYATHRDCQIPDFVQANTKANLGKTTIGSDGWSMQNTMMPSIPFPQPKSGIEAIWDFESRYQGVGVDSDGYTVVSASPGQSDRIDVKWRQIFYFPWGKPGPAVAQKDDDLQWGVWYGYTEPAALAGQANVTRNYWKSDNESYYYFTGQRRVRRLPSYSYDAPIIGFENQYNVDQSFGLYGLPDRFNWKIVGQKDIYVPYNEFGMTDGRTPLAVGAGDHFINPDNRRYELHHVLEIEGTIKPGMRHVMPKRTLYLDPDSWIAVAGDEYDAQGKLWKVKEIGPVPIAELGGACVAINFTMYDLNNGRYVADGIPFGISKPWKYYATADGSLLMKDDYYTMENLQQTSGR